jgi:Pectate lyase superfamily protein/Major tropism determinant N-terminal domain
MAVYQISRIQIRRGQANQGTGLPQLASGEMAWAIDTQELYIGSGSVSEGAPGVSNIRIITQQDLGLEGSLLGLVQYVYGSANPAITTGPTANTPVGRPIATRLDDQITAADFGAKGDGVTDDTSAIQRAINQLFLNPANPANLSTATTSRVVLEMLAGTYKTTSTIYIPSYASLIGAGIDKTIINYVPRSITVTGSTNISTAILTTSNTTGVVVGDIITGNGVPVNTTVTTIVANVSLTLSNNVTVTQTSASFTVTAPGAAFQFVNDSSTPGNPDPTGAQSTSQSRKVHISGITIETDTGINTALQLNSVRESIFENLNLTGGWTGTLSANSVGIDMTAVSSLVTCEANIFRNIRIGSFNYGVFAKDDILNNTFENCYLQNTLQGFCLGLNGANTLANPYGPRQTSIINSKFYNIKQQAVIVYTGTNNTIRDCKYVNVGNNGGTNALSQYPQVYFTTYGNASYNDQSDRHGDLFDPGTGSNLTFALVPYVPEVSGHGAYKYCGTKTITLISKSSYTQILKLPVPWTPTPADRTSGPTGQITYTIDYFYTSQSNAFTRQGTLTISADVANKKIQLSDEYNFAGTDSNFNTNTNDSVVLDFQAQFLDNTGAVTTTNPWTIVLSYVNNQSDSGILNYTYSSVF